MAVDSLQRLTEQFRGLYKNVPIGKVPEGGAAGGSAWRVKDGCIEGFEGYATVSVPVASTIQGLAFYSPASGAPYLVAVAGGRFWEKSAGTWTERTLPAIDNADAVAVTISGSTVSFATLTDFKDFLSSCPDIGDAVHLEGEAASKQNILSLWREGSGYRLTLAAPYTGGAAGNLVTIPNALNTSGSVWMVQMGQALVVSDGNRPLLCWDGVALTRLTLPSVDQHSDFSALLSWSANASGSWYDATKMPYRFRFLWYNENSGEYSVFQTVNVANYGYYQPSNPGAQSSLVVNAASYPRRVPDGVTHICVFVCFTSVTGDDYEYLGKVAVGASATFVRADKEQGQTTSLFAPGVNAPAVYGFFFDHPYRPPGASTRGIFSGAHGSANPLMQAQRRYAPSSLIAHRGVLMGFISGEKGRVEGSGWPASLSARGGIMEPWAWGYHNWLVNPSEGEPDNTLVRAGGRVHLVKMNSLYQLDDRSDDPALWSWDKLRVGGGFTSAVTEFQGRLWGVVRTGQNVWRVGFFDGRRLFVDARLGNVFGMGVAVAFGNWLLIGGGSETYLLDAETEEWYAIPLAVLTAGCASPADTAYDFYVGKAAGVLYRLFTGNLGSFDWQSWGESFSAPYLPKTFRRLALGLRATASLDDVQVEARVDEGTWKTLDSAVVVTTALQHWKGALEGFDGYTIQARVKSTKTAGRLKVEYVEFDADVLAGTRDRR